MERIKDALQRARVERSTGDKDSLHVDSDNPSPAKMRPSELESNESIQYSKTKIEPADRKILLSNNLICDGQDPELVTAYKILRTQVLQRLAAKEWNVLAVTSPGPGHGKTMTAINLAISLAAEVQHTVLLVDLDLRNPTIAQRFNLSVDGGVVDYLQNDVPLSDLLVNPGIERIVILPGTKPVTNTSELLSSPKMVNLVDELKNRYSSRFVIFDLPPLLMTDDALAFGPYVDTTLLIVREGATTKTEIKRSMEMLENINVLGTVLNAASERQKTYYY